MTSGLLLAQAASVLFAAFLLAASPRLPEALAPSGSSYPREIVAGAPPDAVADADRRARAALGLAPPGGAPDLPSRPGHLSQD